MRNKQMFTTLLSLLTSVLLLVSCNKDDDYHNPGPGPTTKKIWKIKTNENDSTLFAYTTSGQLHKVISTEKGIGDHVVTYTFLYDPTSKVTEISSTIGVKYKFLYEANRPKFTENYVGAKKVSENYFEYTNDRVSSVTVLSPFPGNDNNATYRPTFKTIYSYDGAGNLSKASSYVVNPSTNAQTKINEREINYYDDSRNPLEILATLTLVRIFEIPGKHNIIKETLYDDDGQVEETTQSAYVYDNNKYPMTSTTVITAPGRAPITTNFKYYYK